MLCGCYWLQLRRSYPSNESAMISQRERSLKGLFCTMDTACGMESVIQKLAKLVSDPVNFFHESSGNTAWVTKRLMVVAPRDLSALQEGRPLFIYE